MTLEYNIDDIRIYKSNILTREDYQRVSPQLDTHLGTGQWSVDMEDSDRVLRIVKPGINEKELLHLLSGFGIQCSEL
jgi:hypothetical protein